jgi:hypothetical protein
MKMKALFTSVFALAVSIVSSHAELIAYEGFDTANAIGSDATGAGVTGFGFSAYGDTNFRYDLEAGLGYTDSSGNALQSTGLSTGLNAVGVTSGTQNLQLSLSSAITTGTVYASFLLNVTAEDGFGVNAGFQDVQVGNSASPDASLEAVLRSTSSNFGNFSVGNFDDRTGPATANGLYFVVSEINMDTGAMTTWLNPTNLTNIAGTAANTITTNGSGALSDITSFIFSLSGSENGSIDEIRVGTTIDDVSPIPEPNSFVLFSSLVALGAVVFLRR